MEGLREEGFIKDRIRLDPDLLLDYLSPFVEPTKVERFRFTREWMRAQFQRINNPREPTYTIAMKLNLPPSYLLIHRTWLGGIGVLSQLEAEAPFHAILTEYLPGLRVGVTAADHVARTPPRRAPRPRTAATAGRARRRRPRRPTGPASMLPLVDGAAVEPLVLPHEVVRRRVEDVRGGGGLVEDLAAVRTTMASTAVATETGSPNRRSRPRPGRSPRR